MHSYPFSLYASQRLNSIRVPAKGAMQLLVTLLLFSLCLFPTVAAAASPHIYDVPHVGHPGSQATVVGNGFDPNATLDIYFDSTDVGLIDTDNNGSFGMALKAPTIRQNGLTIQIPNDAVPGQHWITAVERITQIQAQVAFTVSADWAQFHYGPERTGFNPFENVLSPESVGNLTTRWTRAGADDSPAVANGLIYAEFWSGNCNMAALDATTGAPLWTYPACPFGTSAVVNGVVYFSAQDGSLYALNAKSGAFLWSYFVGGQPERPAVVNGVVYVGGIYYVDALDASTGTLLWNFHIDNYYPYYGFPVAVANGVVYAVSTYHGLYALDAGTGALLWQSTALNYAHDAPVVANGIVYGVDSDGIYALNASTGALIWRYPTFSSGTPAVANGMVYAVDSGYLCALDAGTGVLLWQSKTVGVYLSSPAVANGVVYVGSPDNNVYAVNASTGAVLWSAVTGSAIYNSPVVVNGMLYIGSTDGYLYAFGLPNQQMSEKFSPPERPDPARLTPDWHPQPNSAVTPPLKK